MVVKGTDLNFVLSGGGSNINPNLSLGGDPSSQPILGTINNLFNDVSPADATDGLVDYRCFYIFNDHATSALYDAEISVVAETEGGSSIEFGFNTSTDIQRIIITGAATGGSLTLDYEGEDVVVAHDSDIGTWGLNLEAVLNGLDDLSGVIVSANLFSGPVYLFDVAFEGDDDNRNHDLLTVSSNDLTGSVTDISINKISEGSPINSIAPLVASSQTSPSGITFSEVSTLFLGTLRAGDGLPIWLKRTTLSGANAIENDGIIIRLFGTPFPS